MKVNSVFLFAVIILFSCCQSKPLAPDQYVQYVNDTGNGLIKETVIGQYEIAVQYKPAELETIREIGLDNMNKNEFDSLLLKKSKLQYFIIKLASADKKSDVLSIGITENQQYYDRIGYLSSKMPGDLMLIEGQDTLRCMLHHFERNYHMAHFNNIMLAFETKDPLNKEDKKLVWDDPVFGLGKLSFIIKADDIHHIPSIEL